MSRTGPKKRDLARMLATLSQVADEIARHSRKGQITDSSESSASFSSQESESESPPIQRKKTRRARSGSFLVESSSTDSSDSSYSESSSEPAPVKKAAKKKPVPKITPKKTKMPVPKKVSKKVFRETSSETSGSFSGSSSVQIVPKRSHKKAARKPKKSLTPIELTESSPLELSLDDSNDRSAQRLPEESEELPSDATLSSSDPSSRPETPRKKVRTGKLVDLHQFSGSDESFDNYRRLDCYHIFGVPIVALRAKNQYAGYLDASSIAERYNRSEWVWLEKNAHLLERLAIACELPVSEVTHAHLASVQHQDGSLDESNRLYIHPYLLASFLVWCSDDCAIQISTYEIHPKDRYGHDGMIDESTLAIVLLDYSRQRDAAGFDRCDCHDGEDPLSRYQFLIAPMELVQEKLERDRKLTDLHPAEIVCWVRFTETKCDRVHNLMTKKIVTNVGDWTFDLVPGATLQDIVHHLNGTDPCSKCGGCPKCR